MVDPIFAPIRTDCSLNYFYISENKRTYLLSYYYLRIRKFISNLKCEDKCVIAETHRYVQVVTFIRTLVKGENRTIILGEFSWEFRFRSFQYVRTNVSALIRTWNIIIFRKSSTIFDCCAMRNTNIPLCSKNFIRKMLDNSRETTITGIMTMYNKALMFKYWKWAVKSKRNWYVTGLLISCSFSMELIR